MALEDFSITSTVSYTHLDVYKRQDLEAVYQYVKEDVKSQDDGSLYPEYEETLEAMFQNGSGDEGQLAWIMDRDGITVVFNPYVLGPWSEGSLETVSYTHLDVYQRQGNGGVTFFYKKSGGCIPYFFKIHMKCALIGADDHIGCLLYTSR